MVTAISRCSKVPAGEKASRGDLALGRNTANPRGAVCFHSVEYGAYNESIY